MNNSIKRAIATAVLAGGLGTAGVATTAAPASAITARCYNIMAAMTDSLEMFEAVDTFNEKREWYGTYLMARRNFSLYC